jgi:hypothetical protein
VQRTIDKLRNSESLLRLQNTILESDVGKLKRENSSFKQGISSIDNKMGEMSSGVEKGLTKKSQCNRCITGNTLLGELEDKIIIIITRSQFINDSYNNSKLSMSNKDSLVNIEITDYTNETNDKFYSVLYNRDNNGAILPTNLMKITNVPIQMKNTKNAIINNIYRHKIQVLQMPDLEKNPEYINIFKHYESAFVPMVDTLKYINEFIENQ